MAYRCRTGPRSARPSELRRWTRSLRPGSEAGCGPAGCRAIRIAASWDQPCHEKASRRAKAVVWVRQVIQATTGRPFQLCYSGPTAATSPLSTCSTARPGSPGTSGTTGRVLLPDARHCASGEAHGDGLRRGQTRRSGYLGRQDAPTRCACLLPPTWLRATTRRRLPPNNREAALDAYSPSGEDGRPHLNHERILARAVVPVTDRVSGSGRLLRPRPSACAVSGRPLVGSAVFSEVRRRRSVGRVWCRHQPLHL